VFFFRYLRRHQLYGKLILNETLAEEQRDILVLEHFLGKEGITKTALRPFGHVDFNGINLEVRSESEYISANTRVIAVDLRDKKLFVKAIGSSEE